MRFGSKILSFCMMAITLIPVETFAKKEKVITHTIWVGSSEEEGQVCMILGDEENKGDNPSAIDFLIKNHYKCDGKTKRFWTLCINPSATDDDITELRTRIPCYSVVIWLGSSMGRGYDCGLNDYERQLRQLKKLKFDCRKTPDADKTHEKNCLNSEYSDSKLTELYQTLPCITPF